MTNIGVAALRGLWLAVILLAGLVAAVLSGAVFWLAGTDVAAALAAGGATFIGVTSLGMAMRRFITDATS
jgi:hypothetical protein